MFVETFYDMNGLIVNVDVDLADTEELVSAILMGIYMSDPSLVIISFEEGWDYDEKLTFDVFTDDEYVIKTKTPTLLELEVI